MSSVLNQLALTTVGVSVVILAALLLRAVQRDPGRRFDLVRGALLVVALVVPVQWIAATLAPQDLRASWTIVPAPSVTVPVEVVTLELVGPAPEPSVPDASAPSAQPSRFTVLTAIGVTYGAGCAVSMFGLLRRLRRTTRLIAAARPVEETALLEAFACAKRLTGVGGAQLLISSEVTAPASWSWGRSVVVVPADMVPGDQTHCALVHELTHLRRRDTAVTVLQRLMIALHWFNPLMYRLSAALDQDRELSCDAIVVRTTGRPRAYAHALLRFGAATGGPPLLAGFASRVSIRRRLEMIERIQSRPGCRARRYGAATIAGAALLLAAHAGLSALAAPSNGLGLGPGPAPRMLIEAVAPEGRTDEETLEHLTLMMHADPREMDFNPGSIVVNQETMVSGEGARVLDAQTIEGSEFHLNLPEGSKLRAELSGERVLFDPQEAGAIIRIFGGAVRLIDQTGTVRATARVSGSGSLLVRAHRTEEIHLVTSALRPDGSAAPVRVTLDTETGHNDEDIHGINRFVLQTPDTEDDPVRVKMQWVYDLHELQKSVRGID